MITSGKISPKHTALTILGKKPKHRFHVNDKTARLSKQQQEMRLKIENVTNNTTKNGLRKDRNEITKTIHQKMKELNEQNLENHLKETENSKNDSSRMFQVRKEIQRQKPKIPLLTKTETGGLTINEKEQAESIAAHFKKQFSKNTQVLNKIHSQPTAMNQPFTAEEIKSAIRSLKNNRSVGDDQIKAEILKSAPDILHKLLADIYNNISETGEHPPELTLGIITPIQKPGKPKGPVQNLRPIMLLSMIRKVLAVCIKKRIVDKLDAEIPPSQAAYRAGRSTTEHVFAAKVSVEKAVTSANYPIYLLILDMSKAFDTVNRSTLMQELAKVLDPDELHIINVLTNTQLKIWCRKENE